MSTRPAAPQSSTDEFKRLDAGSYDELADSYDRHVRRLAAPLAERICDLALIGGGDVVLDVATGTGIAAHRAAQRVGPSGSVLGVDLSEGMIQVAASKAQPHSGALSFRVMDAEHLRVGDRSVDSVISLCAVLHFPRIGVAVAEMTRVARPGARIVVSYGHTRPIRLGRLSLHLARRVAERVLGGTEALQAPQAGIELLSRSSIPEQDETSPDWTESRPRAVIMREMRQAGLTEIKAEWRGHEILYENADEFWEAQTTISTRLRKSLEVAPQEDVDELRHSFIRDAEEILSRGGVLRYPYGAVFISATRPGNRDD